MNSRQSMRIVRRYKFLIGTAGLLGLVGGAAYATLNPPGVTSYALVIVPQAVSTQAGSTQAGSTQAGSTQAGPDIATQALIASTVPVLTAALPAIGNGETVEELQNQVSSIIAAPNVIQIGAHDSSAALAEKIANAVADSYISYVGSSRSPAGQVVAHVLAPAAAAGGGASRNVNDAEYAAGGLLAGLLVGFFIAVQRRRADQRLRSRDELARSAGVPVLASVSVKEPANAANWVRLLEDESASSADSWQMRRALDLLGITGAENPNNRSYVTLVSLSIDRTAQALGPRLAAFAASKGIATALVLGPHKDADSVGELHAALGVDSGTPERHLGSLRVVAGDSGDASWQYPGARLTLVVASVDEVMPTLPTAIRGSTTVLGVSPGEVTAGQLARAAAAANDVGSRVSGVIVANPEPGDTTSGLMPGRGLSEGRRMPTLIDGRITEMR
jgi:capsular polysaccharide biosynthesis protein